MCGIMGYVGPREAAPLLLDGLRRLEYRGYDSAGVAVIDGAIGVRKAEGKIDRLAALLDDRLLTGSVGIGHTRWATHGAPNDANAHPHADPSGEFVVVHNGIIENFSELRQRLESDGHEFSSDTDSEILAHLVARHYEGDLVTAVREAVGHAEGAYALVVISVHDPRKIVAVRRVSPLVVGLGEGETFLASDIPAVLHHTREFLIVEDGELVVVTEEGATIEYIEGGTVERDVFHVDWDAGRAEKSGYAHFMLKEIHEQPAVVAETIGGRVDGNGSVCLDSVGFDDAFAASIDHIWITACGTAYHAGLVGKEIFARLLRIPTSVEYAHEMRYSDPLVTAGSLTVAISQSGETADTLAAARLAAERGSRLLALTNVVGSTLSREADDVLYTRAGPRDLGGLHQGIHGDADRSVPPRSAHRRLAGCDLGRDEGEDRSRPPLVAREGRDRSRVRSRGGEGGGDDRRCGGRVLHRPRPRLRRRDGGLAQAQRDQLPAL